MFTLFCFLFLELTAQVGIGTTNPHASSVLDIESTNAGVLIPRVTLDSIGDNITILSPATSLLVYNTSTRNDVTPRFYFWKTNRWNGVNEDEIKVSGEIFNNSDLIRSSRQKMDPTDPIWFDMTGETQGVAPVPANPPPSQGFEIITSGVYRVSYAISIEMWMETPPTPNPEPNTINLAFYLTTGPTTADIIPGSFSETEITFLGNSNCSKGRIIHLNAGDVIRLFTDTLSTIVYVIPNTATMNIELIQAD